MLVQGVRPDSPEKLFVYNFSGYKGDPNDVETFLNILIFVVEYSF